MRMPMVYIVLDVQQFIAYGLKCYLYSTSEYVDEEFIKQKQKHKFLTFIYLCWLGRN